MTNRYYILKADIISSRTNKGDKLMTEFKQLCKEVSQKHPQAFLSPITITLGDEFQSVVKSLPAAIEVILALEETRIKQSIAWQLRYVLHFGEIETAINKKVAYEMVGDGLTKAKELLDGLKDAHSRFFFSVANYKSSLLNKLFFLYTSLVGDWKVKDFELVHGFIQWKDYKVVADNLEKDKAHMWRRNKSLKMDEYFTVRELILEIANDN